MVRRRVIACALAVLIAASLLASAPAAGAETFASKVKTSTSLYDCTADKTPCKTGVASASAGTTLRMVCWEDGRHVSGIAYNRWFYVRLSNGKQGYIKAEHVSSQTSVRSCADASASNEIRGVIAAKWALAHLYVGTCSSTSANQICPTSSEKQRLNTTWGLPLSWTAGDWSGDCISFAALAWYKATKTIPLRNARQVYDHYKSKGAVHTSTNPPRGALVFWNAWSGGTNYGHVAISLGGSRVIGTKGWDGNKLPIARQAIWSTNYLGWAMP